MRLAAPSSSAAAATRWFAVVAAAVFFTSSILNHGVPALRHDWFWPTLRSEVPNYWTGFVSPWLDNGFGTPNPYPAAYLLATIQSILMWVLGPLLALGVYLFVIGCVVETGTARLVGAVAPGSVKSAWPWTLGIGFLALLNPWTYNEAVAGHIGMILAYGALIWLTALILEPAPRFYQIVFAFAFVAPQIQFALIAIGILIVYSARFSRIKELSCALLLMAPTFIGILGGTSYLSQIPLLRVWQVDQSVAFLQGIALTGYFTHYASPFDAVVQPLGIALFAAAVLAVFLVRTNAAKFVIAGGIFAILIATGLKGPEAPMYSWLLSHVHAIGVYRELYDILAFTIIAYVVALAALLAARSAILNVSVRALIAVTAVTFVMVWQLHLPSTFFVGAGALRQPIVHTKQRVLVLPAFQPLNYRGMGSGYSPNLWATPNAVNPLLGYQMRYPVNEAVGEYLTTGEAKPLAALGVNLCVSQPELTSKVSSINTVQAFDSRLGRNSCFGGGVTRIPSPRPFAELMPVPIVVGTPPKFWENALFFADTAQYKGKVSLMRASASGVDAKADWIDAHFVFASSPFLAQGVGGAYTESQKPMAVLPHQHLLLWLNGVLRDSAGKAFARGKGGYQWVDIGENLSVSCVGKCMLLLETTVEAPAADSSAIMPAGTPIHERAITPFFNLLDVPPHGAALLRLNKNYAPSWFAFSGLRVLRHVRVAGAADGWLLDPSTQGQQIAAVDVIASIQSAFELIAAALLLVLIAGYLRRERHNGRA